MRKLRYFLLERWCKRQRVIDETILWPICKARAQDLDHAKAAFAYHAFNDEVWICLGDEEIMRRIDALT